MSDLTQAMELGFSKLSDLAGKYGPAAIDTAAQVVQVNAIGSLLFGGVVALAGLSLIGVGEAKRRDYFRRLRAWTAWRRERDAVSERNIGAQFSGGEPYPQKPDFSDPDDPNFLWAYVPGVIAAILSALFLLNLWHWVAIFNPKLALAAKIVNALPGIGQ